MKNNKNTICVNVDEVSITTDRQAACKALMAAKETANFIAQCHHHAPSWSNQKWLCSSFLTVTPSYSPPISPHLKNK